MKKIVFQAGFWSFMIVLLIIVSPSRTIAQNQKRVIQLSGVVLGEDSSSVLPGVNVYVPKAGRGATTNSMGFFSMPVLVKDSIVISYVGYRTQHYIVPSSASEYQTIIVTMVQDTTMLQTVTVMPFPTEEVFKEAVLALNMPLDEGLDKKNLSAELFALMLKTTPMDGPQNQRYYLNQWAGAQMDRYHPVSNPFLNPFNWAKFFNQLKKNKKAKK